MQKVLRVFVKFFNLNKSIEKIILKNRKYIYFFYYDFESDDLN